MDVILLERVRNLGNLGDEVSVKNGARPEFPHPPGQSGSRNPLQIGKSSKAVELSLKPRPPVS